MPTPKPNEPIPAPEPDIIRTACAAGNAPAGRALRTAGARSRRRALARPKRHSAPASPGNAPAARSLSWSLAAFARPPSNRSTLRRPAPPQSCR